MRVMRVRPIRSTLLAAGLLVAGARGATAQMHDPVWTDSTRTWRTEVSVVDAVEALDTEVLSLVRECAQNGLSTLAVNLGYAGATVSRGMPRLFMEVTVIPAEGGYLAYPVFGVKTADENLLPAGEGVAEVRGEDLDTLCAAIQDAASGLEPAGR